MEKGLKAFFYEYKYYLFPDDCLTLTELKARGKVCAKRLKEERCMAPDFIYESIAEEELIIENPDRLFEVSVNLYTGAEYDEILKKQTDRVCIGCRRYIPDGDPRDTGNLDGHHREISLAGVCYEREGENEFWDFGTSVDVYWWNVSQKLNELAECIDKGNQKKLNKILNAELKKFFLPTEFYGMVHEGKYCICLCLPSITAFAFYDYIAHCGSQKGGALDEAGWKVLACRPAGAAVYRGKTKISALKVRLSGSEQFCDLEVYTKKPLSPKKQDQITRDVYAWLGAEIGEERPHFTVGDVVFTSDEGNYISMEEAAKILNERFDERYGDDGSETPHGLEYGVDGEWKNALPYRDKIISGVTGCPMLSLLDTEQLKGDPWWRQLVSFGYLYVPRAVDMPDNPAATLVWYLTNMDLVPEPLRDPEDTVSGGLGIGVAHCGEDGFILDNLVASEKKFFRTLRILAPVLRAYRAKAVMVNDEGVMAYECDYEFTPVDSGI